MWNWREYYDLLAKVRKHTQVLCSGECIMQIPVNEAYGIRQYVLLHTVSGRYFGPGKDISFSGYQAGKVKAAKLVWLYLMKIADSDEILFNAVFMKNGNREQEKARKRQQHGIRMVYKRMAQTDCVGETWQHGFSVSGHFHKLAILGCGDTEIKNTSIEKLLHVFAGAADERGMVILSEENARAMCGNYRISSESSTTVNGPSLTRETLISAPNSPCAVFPGNVVSASERKYS